MSEDIFAVKGEDKVLYGALRNPDGTDSDISIPHLNKDLDISKDVLSKDTLNLMGILGSELTEEEVNLSRNDFGQAFYRMAKLYYDNSDLKMAAHYFYESLKYVQRPKDDFSVLKIVGFLIRIFSERRDPQCVERFTQLAHNVITDLGENLGSLNAEYFYNLGVDYQYQGDFKTAGEHFLLALDRSKLENVPELMSKCLLSLATNAYQRKDFDLALEYLQRLKQLLSIIGKNYLAGVMHLYLGRIYTDIGRLDKALNEFKLANIILQNKKCHNLTGQIMLNKGIVYKLMGDYDKATIFFNIAKETSDVKLFKRLHQLVETELQDVSNCSVDIYLDKTNRKVKEKTLGVIDFKHRFVLLEILFLLAKNAGTYYDKEELAKSVWGDEYNPLIHDKLIYTSVSRLRKLIEPRPENKDAPRRKYIIRGKDGYTFNPQTLIRFEAHQQVRPSEAIANVDLSSPV